MKGKLPTPGWAGLLFLTTLVLNAVINGILLVTSPDLGILFGEPLAILIPTLLAVHFLRVDARTTLRLRLPSATDLLLAVPLAVSLAVLNDQLSNLTSQVFPIPEQFREGMVQLLRAGTPYEWMVRILGLAVGAAVAEEILFRGFIQTSLERSALGRAGAILLTSLLFAVMHVIPQGYVSYTLAGLVLGIVALATRSILIPILIHAVNNASAIVLLNAADLESLGQPVWIPPGILIPALLIFTLSLAYYLRRAAEVPAPEPSSPQLAPHRTMPEPADSAAPAEPVIERKKLGWLAVGCAVTGGALVVLGLFFFSLLYSPQIRHQPILEMREALVKATEQGPLASRITEEFDALLDFNASGRLSVPQFLRLLWIYSNARSDGRISEEEIEILLLEVRTILDAGARVRRL
jgi:membrane protease YdiL (CAAX protease family)